MIRPDPTAARRNDVPSPAPRRRAAPAMAAVLLMLAAPADAQEPAAPAGLDWVGKRVIQKFREFQLKVEDRVVDRKNEIVTYRVGRVNGPWLWLEAEGLGLAGWALAEHVVPIEDAIAFFTRYIQEYPDDVHGFFMRAIIWYQERNEPDLALGDLNDAIRLDPIAAYLWNDRGEVWRSKKQYSKAVNDYTEAIRLAPTRPGPYNNRGLARYAQKDYDKAIADYTEAIRLDPNGAPAHANRGNARLARKDCDGAIADYDRAIRIDPKYIAAYRNRARALLLARREGAMQSARQGLKAVGWRGDISIYTAIVGHLAAIQAGDREAAKAFLDDAATHADKGRWPYPIVEYLRGDLTETALLAKADDDDRRAEIRGYIGYAQLLRGREEDARGHFRWLREHGDPSRVGYVIAMAELERLGSEPVAASRP